MTTATASPAAFDRSALERLIESAPQPDWVVAARRAALARVEALGLPDRRDENWMRTDLRPFKPQAWGPRSASAAAIS